jgi:hypothetical protein
MGAGWGTTALVTGLLIAAGVGTAPVVAQTGADATADASAQKPPAEKYRALLDEAWGPEPPHQLESYLEIREELLPIFKKYADGIVQWSLREAGTRPMFAPALLGVYRIRARIDEMVEERSLDFEDYRRMTILVYGRWLRAARESAPPERAVARALQELEVGLARRLDNNPPEDERERHQVADRLEAVRHHLRFIRHFAFSEEDKQKVLERIDPETREWLEAHRERIESYDFGVFDTAPPSRERAGS